VPAPRLLFVCTGNATRSVIAAALVRRDRPDWSVDSAGTWAIPGLPSSRRTLAALDSVGVSAPGHLSATLGREHLDDADVVVAFERDHVRFIRHMSPESADRVATLPRLLLPDWPGADLAAEDPHTWGEIEDPAGREVDDFITCARIIDEHIADLLPRLDALST
jgi:protein-tyrosine-phosphatase